LAFWRVGRLTNLLRREAHRYFEKSLDKSLPLASRCLASGVVRSRQVAVEKHIAGLERCDGHLVSLEDATGER